MFWKNQEIQDGGSKVAAILELDVIVKSYDVISLCCRPQRKHFWMYYLPSKFRCHSYNILGVKRCGPNRVKSNHESSSLKPHLLHMKILVRGHPHENDPSRLSMTIRVSAVLKWIVIGDILIFRKSSAEVIIRVKVNSVSSFDGIKSPVIDLIVHNNGMRGYWPSVSLTVMLLGMKT